MKHKKILSLIIVTAASLCALELFAQSEPSMSKAEYNRMDSLQEAYKRDQVQTQKADDAELIRNAKTERMDTKAEAKEAERVNNEAQDAAKQSKSQLKTEERAQKLRKRADKQAQKAKAARDKSNLN